MTEGRISDYYDSNDEIILIANITTHQIKHETGEYHVHFHLISLKWEKQILCH